MMLVADGAERYAKANGISLCDNKELISPVEWNAWQQCKKDTHAAEHHRGHEQALSALSQSILKARCLRRHLREYVLQVARADW